VRSTVFFLACGGDKSYSGWLISAFQIYCVPYNRKLSIRGPMCSSLRVHPPVFFSQGWRLVLASLLIQVDSKRFKRSWGRWCIVDIGRSGPGMLTHRIDGTTPAANLLSLVHSISLRAADGGFWMNEFCNGPVRGGSSAEAKFAPILEIH